METNKVVEIKSSDDFYSILKALPNKYFVVDFNADWCGPCQRIKSDFHELAHNNPHIGFLSVNIDNVSEVGEDYEITALPTFLVLMRQEIQEKVVGADIKKLTEVVNKIN